MKLPVQAAAVVRDHVSQKSQLTASNEQVVPQGKAVCPPGSRTTCQDGDQCCENSGTYYCAPSC